MLVLTKKALSDFSGRAPEKVKIQLGSLITSFKSPNVHVILSICILYRHHLRCYGDLRNTVKFV